VWRSGLVGVLLVLTGGVVVLAPSSDRATTAIEATLDRYARAMAAQDRAGALQEIAPSERERWEPWVDQQIGNIYEVRGLGVRAPSATDRLVGGASSEPTDVTVVLDVNRGYPGFFYQPTTRVGVRQVEGRWYLEQPLLAPEAESL
jgi:hypothetical protein